MAAFQLPTDKPLSPKNICLKYPLHLIKQHGMKEASFLLPTGDKLAHNESFAPWFEGVGCSQDATDADEESSLVPFPYLFMSNGTIWAWIKNSTRIDSGEAAKFLIAKGTYINARRHARREHLSDAKVEMRAPPCSRKGEFRTWGTMTQSSFEYFLIVLPQIHLWIGPMEKLEGDNPCNKVCEVCPQLSNRAAQSFVSFW